MGAAEKLKSQRDVIFRLAEKYGAKNIRIFGSVARGNESKTSDIDFLVNLDSNFTLLDLGGFLVELERLLGCPVDIVTEEGLNPALKERILKEAKPL